MRRVIQRLREKLKGSKDTEKYIHSLGTVSDKLCKIPHFAMDRERI